MNLRIANRIARTELAALFFSPVAWLLLVVFAIHVGLDLGNIVHELVKIKVLSGDFHFSATAGIVLGANGLYEVIQDSIYLYIPLLTMNLMSREYASGSDKLLYSSPVSSLEIIFGKFLATLVCALLFTVLLALPVIVMAIYIPTPDYTLVLAGLLALFLLIVTYCSIGLFMSSLTQYQVIAAVSTLAALAFFNYVGNVGQNSVAIREITYWLSIKGRASEMLSGLVTSDDIIYFIAVSAFFLALAVIRLDNQKKSLGKTAKAMRYVGAAAVLVLVAFLSGRPGMRVFWDATHNKARTLSEASQKVMKELKGGLTITTYVDVQDEEFVNFIPSHQLKDREHFKQYTRFKPEIRMKYVYYYSPIKDTAILNRYPGLDESQVARELAIAKGWNKPVLCSAESLKDKIDLEEEKYQFVRVIRRDSGEESRLRLYNDMFHHPNESEISAAMKKMLVEPVKIGAITGHGERSMRRNGDRDYSIFATDGKFRNSMVNQGFDVIDLDLSRDSIPSGVNILLLADSREEIPASEMALIESYLDKGGNMMLVTDVDRTSLNPLIEKIGLKTSLASGLDDDIAARGTSEATEKMGGFYKSMARNPQKSAVNMTGAVSLEIADTSLYKPTVLLRTDSTALFPSKNLAMALRRDRGEDRKQQRIIVVGDADCFSNAALMLSNRQSNISFNFSMLPGSFRWLCYGEFPVASPRPPIRDNDCTLSPQALPRVKRAYTLYIPLLIALCGIMVLYRRRRR